MTTPTRSEHIQKAKAEAVAQQRAAEVANTPSNKVAAIKQMLDLRATALTSLTGNAQRTQQLISILLGRVSRAPQLLECEPLSLYLATQQLASLGLSPLEERKHWYLLPYRNKNLGGRMEAQLRVSYHGYTYLAMQHPDVADVGSEVVYRGEAFEFDRFNGTIKHPVPLREDVHEPDLVAAYAWVRMRDGRVLVEVMSRAQVLARRAKAKDGTFWNAWPEEMWRKTALNKLLRGERVPKADALVNAIDGESREEIKLVEFEDVTPEPDATPVDAEAEVDYSEVPEIPVGGPTDHGLIARANELMGDASMDWAECAHWLAKKHLQGVIPEGFADVPPPALEKLVAYLELAAAAQRRRDDAEGA